MALCFSQNGQEFKPHELSKGALYQIDGDGTPNRIDRVENQAGVYMQSVVHNNKEVWILLSTPSERVYVNGRRSTINVKILSDQDHIRSKTCEEFYFSEQSLNKIEPFASSSENKEWCARCKQELEPGSDIVKCRVCGVVMHENDELNCWTFGEKCICGASTSLSNGYDWTPDSL